MTLQVYEELPYDYAMSSPDAALFRQMVAHLVGALAVWLAVAALVTAAGMFPRPPGLAIASGLPDTRYALHAGLPRFGILFWRCLVVLLVLELVVFCLSHLGPMPQPIASYHSRNLGIAFACLALLYGGLSAKAMFDRRDPWEYLPGGPPFTLREFAYRHPQLHVETVGAMGGTRVFLARGSSSRVYFDEGELQTAVLSWDKCTDPAEVMRLGGPPPFPGTQCWVRIQILREQRRSLYTTAADDDDDDEDTKDDAPVPKERAVRFVYHGGRPRVREIHEHVLAWAQRAGIETNVTGGEICFTSGGRAWTVNVTMESQHEPWVDDIYVECAETLAPTPSSKL